MGDRVRAEIGRAGETAGGDYGPARGAADGRVNEALNHMGVSEMRALLRAFDAELGVTIVRPDGFAPRDGEGGEPTFR